MKVKTKSGKTIIKKPKIQRLITPTILHRRRYLKTKHKRRKAKAYEKRKEYFSRLVKKSQAAKNAKKQQTVIHCPTPPLFNSFCDFVPPLIG